MLVLVAHDMVKTARDQELQKARSLARRDRALAHLHRDKTYRSTVWRTRLDRTGSWAVVFSSNDASPLPLVLVGILIFAFLGFEARQPDFLNQSAPERMP